MTGNRRVITGVGPDGRSTVVSDGVAMAGTTRLDGASVEEIWWQDSVPAHADDRGAREGDVSTAPPPSGAAVRLFVLPPDEEPGEWRPNLHRNEALHVITVLSGEIAVYLESDEVLLRARDSIVVPGTMHDLRNPGREPATLVYTVFPLCQ
ncbi:cupin domain-containing protein [Saccharomonospora sp. NPDC046836]|uniref:cupin domain-containing protein n=1 Tax=Saccharomonospora sp. NPDC046836 TaxID=3156921 RepID=UPI0033FAC126